MRAAKTKGGGDSTGRRGGTRTASRRTSGKTSRTASGATGPRKKGASGRKSGRRWIAAVTTDSTHPPQGLFTKDAPTIARTLASKRVSPKGPASGLRMLTYFINRAGKGLKPERKAELEKAKALLSKRIRGRKKSAHKTE